VVDDGMVRKAVHLDRGDLPESHAVFMLNSQRAARVGVRGSIVAEKRHNGRGVKGARKVDV